MSLDPYDDNILLNNLVLRGVRRPTKLGIANPPKKLQKTLPEVQARSLSSRPLYSEPNPFSPKKNPRLTSSSSSSDSVKSDKMGNQGMSISLNFKYIQMQIYVPAFVCS